MRKIRHLLSFSGDSHLGLRLGLCFALLAVMLISVGALGLRQLRGLDNLAAIVDQEWAKVQMSRRAQAYSNLNSRVTMQIFLTTDEKEISSLMAQSSRNSAEISDLIDRLRQKVQSTEESDLLDAINQKRGPYVESYRRALHLMVDEKNPQSAREVMAREALPRLGEYHQAWDAYVDYQGQQMDRGQDREAAIGAGIRKTSLLLIALEVLLVAAIGIFVIRHVTRHIKIRKRSEGLLLKAREELEHRVDERTVELAMANEELRTSEAKFKDLFDHAPVGYHELDTEGRITSVNLTELDVLGYEVEEMEGRFAWDFIVEPVSREAVRKKLSGQVPLQPFERTFIRKDGSLVPMLVKDQLIHDIGGQVTGIRSTLHDISERKRAERELEAARNAALESARLKSEFLANTSHEIRTPMNGIIGMTGLLLDTELTAEQREFAETIRSSGDALLTIINDILDFSKIEAGKLKFETLDFLLNNTVEDTIELLAERAHQKRIELASLIYSDVPRALSGDPGRLRQVITNLLGNAIKFTERGEVILRAQKESETESDALIRFEITDTGVGISEAAQRNLFQAFTQADGSTTRKYGGTGLGLAISKQLVELMDGEIGVSSVEGKGSTFWFTARFKKQPAAAQIEQPPVSLYNWRVLIVDDNSTNRRILTHQVGSWGMIYEEADSGAQALELLRAATAGGEAFDLVVLDLMMPGMDGFELARKIKSDPKIAKVHLVMLTSFGERGHAATARESGVAAYLTKPVRQSQLFDCLANVVSAALAGPSSRLVTKHALKEMKMISNKLILLAEDNVVNQKVALRQLQKLGYRADAVANGREAIAALDRIPYELVLMDCQMPEMDGYEATAEIRRREGNTRHTWIVAMTANALKGDRENCLAAGMDEYVSKPVKLEELGAVIARIFSKNGTHVPA